jgi:phage shock protein PspC (stress-responsive transcriptional regulator)
MLTNKNVVVTVATNIISIIVYMYFIIILCIPHESPDDGLSEPEHIIH